MNSPPETTATLPGPGAGFAALLRRDLLLAWRRRGEVANPLIFFAMVTALIPLAVGPEPSLLARLAPGMVWIMALLGTLLAADALFREDFLDGALEFLVLSPQPLWLLVLARVVAHWLVTGVPITLLSPLLAGLLALPGPGLPALVVGLGLGTLAFSLLGAVGGAGDCCNLVAVCKSYRVGWRSPFTIAKLIYSAKGGGIDFARFQLIREGIRSARCREKAGG